MSSYSKRTVAIALAAAVSFSGAQAIPATSPRFIAAADAAEAASAADTVSLEGVVLRQTGEKYDGTLFDPANPDNDQANYALRFNIDLDKVAPSTVLSLTTNSMVDGDRLYGFTYQGTKQNNVPILLGTKKVGSYDTSGGIATLKFNENLPANAGELTLDLDLYRYGKTYATEDQVPKDVVTKNRLEHTLSVSATRTDGSETSETKLTAPNDWYGLYYAAPNYTKNNFLDVSVVQDPSQENRIEINEGKVQAALNPNVDRKSVTVVVKPHTGDRPADQLPLGKWAFLESATNPENISFSAYEVPSGNEQRRKQVKVPAEMSYNVQLTDAGELKVTFTNVPKGIAPEVVFKHLGVTNYIEDAEYGLELVSVESDPASANVGTPSSYHRPVKKLDGGSVKLVAATNIAATVNGKVTAEKSPAAVGGTDSTLTVTITNTGNTSLSAPTVTAGSTTKTFEDITIQPGDSQDVKLSGWHAPTGDATTDVSVTFPVGANASTKVFTKSLPAPAITVNNGSNPVAGKDAPINLEVPAGTEGNIEVSLPDGTTETLPISDGKASLTKKFAVPGRYEAKATVVDSNGNRGETTEQRFTVIPDRPTVNPGAPVAGRESKIEIAVPEGTTGAVEIEWPDGTKTTHAIENGKATANHTFSKPEDVELKATVIAPGNIRGLTRSEPVTVSWPSDLSSIAELKPDCRDALTTDGVLGALALILALGSRVRIPAIEESIAQVQRQLGIFNPQLADAAREWGPRAAAAAGVVGVLALLGNTYGKCNVGTSSSTSSTASSSADTGAAQK